MTKLHRQAAGSLGALALVLAIGTHVQAHPASECVDAYERRDFVSAESLCRPLAKQGNGLAQFIIGVMHYLGQGVPQDDFAAVEWYRRAADQGISGAQFGLGTMFASGRGVPQNKVVAARLYRLAADQGMPEAQYNLAIMYSVGEGVPQDFVQAHMWFNLAAAEGHSRSAEKRELIASLMTGSQIEEAQRLAREWLAEHQ